MNKAINQKLKLGRVFSILTISIGIILMGYMVNVESEPGALPLLLILFGTAWFFINRYQIRKQS